MAADGRFFRRFAHVNRRFRTPLEAIALLAGMALVLLIGAYLLFPDGKDAIDNLTTSVVIIDAVFFALTGFALVAIRLRRKALEASSFRAPLFPVIPVLFVLGELGILTGSFIATEDKTLFLLAVIWIIAAAMLYAVFFRRPRHIIP